MASLSSRTILRGRCEHSMVGRLPATHSCTSTIVFKRPPSYAKLCQPTIQPKQTNPQADLNTTLLSVIFIVNIRWAAQEVRLSRWVSKSWSRYFMLLRSYPAHYILCFCWLFEFEIFVLCLLSRSHTISNTYILPVGNTLYRKRHITRTICVMLLQSILEAGLHSRPSFWVRLTNQFDAFFNPKNASHTNATNE